MLKINAHTKNTLLQAATNQSTNQSLQESIFSPTQEKLKIEKLHFQEIKLILHIIDTTRHSHGDVQKRKTIRQN